MSNNIRFSAIRVFMDSHPERTSFCEDAFSIWLEKQKQAGMFWGS